jgi:1-acyl-sn-glycerol-3-phosphate acyltransferase
MLNSLRSLWIWFASAIIIFAWLPLVALSRLFDRDPVRYRTGRLFRMVGIALAKANPSWHILVSGETISNPRKPYVVVSNHQSMADIPIISHLPWEMKWLGKVELFRTPIIGWMMKLSGDIPVERGDRRKSAQAFIRALKYLEQRCSVMFFPEGTRSIDSRVHRFADGAFQLAIKAKAAVLPVAIDGSFDCLPKKSWKFGPALTIRMKVLPPIETTGLTLADVERLRDTVRQAIIAQIAEWRSVDASVVDALSTTTEI